MSSDLTLIPPVHNVTFYLTRDEGESLRNIIDDHYNGTFKAYCRDTGFSDTNICGILSGSRVCSLATIKKLMSAIPVSVSCELKISLQSIQPEENPSPESLPSLDDFGMEDDDIF
jgi:hypothetical protein